MDSILTAALPWYVRHWQFIMSCVILAAGSAYVALLHHQLDDRTKALKTANETIVQVTAKYESDILKLKGSIAVQNTAIDKYEAAAKGATEHISQAATKSTEVKTKTDKQVNAILVKDKPATAEAAVTSLVDGVNNLSWESLK